MAKATKAEITHIEREINNLWGELNTVNIPHTVRIALEHQMQEVEDEFKSVAAGHLSAKKLQKRLDKIDLDLASAAIKQAESEISKIERQSAQYQGLENVQRSLDERGITPNQARHEVKRIRRNS
ncbi:MAG: hypothetical protein S4CHLAM81_04560 [Chlamydiales bacterium]|nr:hypothetical protein [Chlamydiales bacterium]MCH9635245.1 hypothetical protein [Chlamydiales bacterium]MCH9703451.1 hypothetical protein [Chlamydiota bacterium]